MVVDATLANGAEQRYQLFIGGRPAHPWPEFLEGKDRELLAVVPDGEGGEVVFYDALIDPDLAVDVLHLVAPDIEVEVRRPIVLEHSNSSVVFDERTILKVLRKVEPGPNPDVEIPRVLAERGYEHVLPPHRRAPPRRHGPRGAPRLPRGRHRGVAARSRVGARRAGVAAPARGERRRPRARLRPARAPPSPASTWRWPTPGGTSPAILPRWVDQMLGGLDEVADRGGADVARRRRGAGPARRGPHARRRRRRDPHPRRPPPRPGDPGRRRLAGPRLRGRAGPAPRRPLHPVLAAARRGGDAPVVPLRRRHRPRRVGPGRRRAAGAPRRVGAAQPRRVPHRLLRARRASTRSCPSTRPAAPRCWPPSSSTRRCTSWATSSAHRPELVSIPLAGIDRLVARARPHMTPLHRDPRPAHRVRPPPLRAGQARAALGRARRPRGGRRRPPSRCGRPTPARCRWSASSTAGTGPPARSSASTPACGQGSCAGIGSRTPYKYAVTGADGRTIDRADPMAQFAEHSGGMASIVFESQHAWQDGDWMARARRRRPGRATA